ncbi:glycosyltransferase [Venenivibrio stagnispumantis]|uniref:Glycosyl transferases group 1 n=1 Tax=Venenivibrio stagnispumantis TaxID=407998 RepID=A0AA45WJ17_9AQUI|nr:glycosyltransferase [Venenivibrio stagnispumantis]MCW4572516.1 glycosyltransferase [Venenivibrio stagnispumantis]SMP02029.1 Glycosyl transferases group 1 [Venenivibrio stagnispumantis]
MEENKVFKPRVLFIKTPDPKSFNESIIEALSKSLSARGYETKTVEPTPENIQQTVEEIIEFKPLFSFDINLDGMIFAERDNEKKPFCDILGNIHLTWFIDDPMIHFTKLKSVLNSNQILYLTIDVEHGQWISSIGKNVAFLAPGINPSKIPPMMEKDFDIAFIGPITDPSIIEQNWRERFDDTLFGFAVELGRLIYRNPDIPIRFASGYLISQFNPQFQEAIYNFQRQNEDDFMNLLVEIGLYAMNLRRWNIIDNIDNFEVSILGQVIGETKENIVIYEDIQTQQEIINFLSRTKISLLSQPPFLPSGLGFTVFDSVATGALTFVEERLSSKAFFTPDEEIITYHPMDFIEIEGKLYQYLEEDVKRREEIAKAGRERAFREHTLYNRGELLANIMDDIIKRSLQEEENKPEENN